MVSQTRHRDPSRVKRPEPFHAFTAESCGLPRQKTGMIFQHFHLYGRERRRENAAFPLEVAGASREEIEKVDEPRQPRRINGA